MKMSTLFWQMSSWMYRTLGPKNAWRFAMSPLPKLVIFSIINVFGKNEITAQSKYGFKMKLRIEDYLVGGYLHLGETNPHETRVIRRILKERDVFFDVGAYRGWYTLNAAQKVGSNGLVYAFEPNPEIFQILEENCKLNNLKNVKLKKLALSDRNGRKNFWVGGEEMLGSLKKEHVTKNTKTKTNMFSVATKTFDEFCKEEKIKKIRLIKIDVEGVDLEVLKGAKNMLKACHPYLIVEVFGLSKNADSKREKEILTYLSSLGYRAYEFVGEKLRIFHNNEESQIINLFFANDDTELKKLHLL